MDISGNCFFVQEKEKDMSYLEVIKEIILMPKTLIENVCMWLWNDCTMTQLIIISIGFIALAVFMNHIDEWAFGKEIMDGEYVVVPVVAEEKAASETEINI